MGQDAVSLVVPVQCTVTPKFAAALAEAITAPAIVLKLTPKVTSISSGLLAMPRTFSTTVLAAGRTLFRASSKVSLAFSILSSRPARTVPPVSGSSISTTMLPPSSRENSTRCFMSPPFSWCYYAASRSHAQEALALHLTTTDEEIEQGFLKGSAQVAEEERWERQV